MIKGKNYISVESVIANVRLRLRSFDEPGLLTDSTMIANAEYVISRAGYSLEEHKMVMLDVEDRKAEIPTDLSFVEHLYKYDIQDPKEPFNTRRYYLGGPNVQKMTSVDTLKKYCFKKCTLEETTEEIIRTLFFEVQEPIKQKFNNKLELKYTDNISESTNSKLFCTSEDYYTIKGNHFLFNFDQGFVLLKYTGRAYDEDGYPLVEDDPVLIRAIEDYVLLKELETIYYNGEVDVQQRLMLARTESIKSLDEAITLNKIPSYQRSKAYVEARTRKLYR